MVSMTVKNIFRYDSAIHLCIFVVTFAISRKYFFFFFFFCKKRHRAKKPGLYLCFNHNPGLIFFIINCLRGPAFLNQQLEKKRTFSKLAIPLALCLINIIA